MTVETRFFRSDTHTVNGLTAYKLLTSNTTAYTTKSASRPPNYVGIRVWKRSADGSETEITLGKCVAMTPYDTTLKQWSGTWSCPSVSLSPQDAIVVRVYTCEVDGTPATLMVTFTTEQLGAQSLDASTWTVYYWLRYTLVDSEEIVSFWFGSSTYNSRIENFTWTPVPAIVETIVAKDYPMNYLPTPVKAEQLTSKVSGATIIKVNQDYPLTLIKKDKAQELKSKFTPLAPPPPPIGWEGFVEEMA